MNEWISVKDRLPDDMEPVDVTVEISGKYLEFRDVRFNRTMDGYNDETKTNHPNGMWEYCEDFIDEYWKELPGEVTDWRSYEVAL